MNEGRPGGRSPPLPFQQSLQPLPEGQVLVVAIDPKSIDDALGPGDRDLALWLGALGARLAPWEWLPRDESQLLSGRNRLVQCIVSNGPPRLGWCGRRKLDPSSKAVLAHAVLSFIRAPMMACAYTRAFSIADSTCFSAFSMAETPFPFISSATMSGSSVNSTLSRKIRV